MLLLPLNKARRALRALRGLVRLKSLVDSNAVKLQTTNTLQCLQMLSKVQLQILSRRVRMTEENQALQRQLQLKHEKELERTRLGEQWDDSPQSKEQSEANLMNKQEAAVKRERALAYAFSHQWRSSSRSMNPTFTDPNNPQWGWSWVERWAAARPWIAPSTTDTDNASLQSAPTIIAGDMTKSFARRASSSPRTKKSVSRNPSHGSPSTGRSRTKQPSLRGGWEDDSRSARSLQAGRRCSFGGSSSVRDDESLASSSAVSTLPSYMSPTQSAKAKSRIRTPSSEMIATPEVKKRLSFSMEDKQIGSSPATVRRHSGPPKMDNVASMSKVG